MKDLIFFFLKAIPSGDIMCDLIYSLMISIFLYFQRISCDPFPFFKKKIYAKNILSWEENHTNIIIHFKNLICKKSI